MGRNQWSHPVMVALARQVCGNSWLHNSQISGLRHAGLTSPGPRQFIALEQLNKAINKYQLTSKTIPGTDSSRTYKNTQPIIEAGATESPPLGWFIEVFCGCREPNCPNWSGKSSATKLPSSSVSATVETCAHGLQHPARTLSSSLHRSSIATIRRARTIASRNVKMF